MRIIFITLLSIILLIMIICSVIGIIRKNEFFREVSRLTFFTVCNIASYLAFLVVEQTEAADLLLVFHYASAGWLALCLFFLVRKYAYAMKYRKSWDILFVILTVMDMLFVLFHVKLHFVLCYFMLLAIAGLLIYRISKCTYICKRIYISLFNLIVFETVANFIRIFYRLPYEVALLLYLAVIILIFYHYLFATSNEVLISTVVQSIEGIEQCILCFDLRGKCVYVNSYTFRLFPRAEKDLIHDVECCFAKWLSENESGLADYEERDYLQKIEGKQYFLKMEFQKIKNEKEKIYGYLIRLEDKTGEWLIHQREQYLASHDSLTTVQKREVFYAAASELMRRNPYIQWNIISTDITNFKLINDMFGEKIGDQVLIKQAAFWKQLENDHVIVGRIINDRFAILMPRNEFDASFFMERMDKLQEIEGIKNFKLHVTMGIFEVENIFENVRVMCDKAFLANTSIDDNFQEHIAYYDKEMLEQLLHEKQMLNDFDYSLEKDKFCMYFQPQMDREQRLVGAEALVRWKHPDLGLLYPDQFVKIYERAGLIYELDKYVWELAATKLKEWRKNGRDDLSISVNISAKDFYYADIYSVFTKLVRQYDIEPSCLNLEITESTMLKNTDHLHIIHKLKSYGFHIEIDDFGSGYSSLHMLTDMKADILKIDMLFLSKTEHRQRSRSILQSVIKMAKQLDMKVIAEGVENSEQLKELISDGCDYFQGYYFSEPISVEEFERKYHICENVR